MRIDVADGWQIVRRVVCLALFLSCAALACPAIAHAQAPASARPVASADLGSAIDRLGDLDYTARRRAARTIRRASPGVAVPALQRAAVSHADGYVRYLSLVLLIGFSDSGTPGIMRQAIVSPNDRLRAVAYGFFEHHPDASMIPELLVALEKEQGEFVRPALVRAAAAHGSDTRIRSALIREVGRGQDFFRSAVVEALGDFKASYAFDALIALARADGPLQSDAIVALGRLGDRRAAETLSVLQRSAPRRVQPPIAAAFCLLGLNCDRHEAYLAETLAFADANASGGYQELLRAATTGLGALAATGRRGALAALFDVGIPAGNATRETIAIALSGVALRNTAVALAALEAHADRARAIELVADGFDMLEDDLDKEFFFASVRRAYADAPDRSPWRLFLETLIRKFDF